MYLEIGKIAGTHGLKGEIKVFPITDDPKRFQLLKEINVYLRDKVETYTIQCVRYNKQFVLLKLKEIDHIDRAALLKNGLIKIPKDQALPLEEDQYYIGDLIGLKVFEEENHLGIISDVIQTGANDVYVVSREGKKDLLIPSIKQCILNVNIDQGIMKVHLLKGLE